MADVEEDCCAGYKLLRSIGAADEDQFASMLVCSVAGALLRYGSMTAERVAQVHGISVDLVNRALGALASNNEVRYDLQRQGWVHTYADAASAPPSRAGGHHRPDGRQEMYGPEYRLAAMYFAAEEEPGLRSDGVPDEGIEGLRLGYIQGAVANPQAMRELALWAAGREP